MDEDHQTGTAGDGRSLQCAPIGVVAQIGSGIARAYRGHAHGTRRLNEAGQGQQHCAARRRRVQSQAPPDDKPPASGNSTERRLRARSSMRTWRERGATPNSTTMSGVRVQAAQETRGRPRRSAWRTHERRVGSANAGRCRRASRTATMPLGFTGDPESGRSRRSGWCAWCSQAQQFPRSHRRRAAGDSVPSATACSIAAAWP